MLTLVARLCDLLPSEEALGQIESELLRSTLRSVPLALGRDAHVFLSLLDEEAALQDDRGKILLGALGTNLEAEVGAVVGEEALRQVLSPLQQAAAHVAEAESDMDQVLEDVRRALGRRDVQWKSLRTGKTGFMEYLVELPVKTKPPAGWAIISQTKQYARYHPESVAARYPKVLQRREELSLAGQMAWEDLLGVADDRLHVALRQLAAVTASLDALSALATIAELPGYCRPVFSQGAADGAGHTMRVVGARHPTIEHFIQASGSNAAIVPNDICISIEGASPRNCSIVTGPNMGGKSSYVRTVAVIAILAQVGSFVPADSAECVVLDGVFTRMGADDDLAAGMSTFFLEMHHTAEILRLATSRSLVIMDELGRGTATNDGIAIAWATLRYVLQRVRCATLFVTHYPQITELADEPEGRDETSDNRVVNIHMSYLEPGRGFDPSESDEHPATPHVDDVTFLYRAVLGRATTSHGLNVARMAGFPANYLRIAAASAREFQAQASLSTSSWAPSRA
mmetsp:Transcript_28926/g.84435  ORF Transcript_28926/g.84435 Transcript_28926/m.84435 type:complete len:514 (-) Transcript_28926:237-1778(-)